MNTSLVRLVMAALTAFFVLAACAGQTGAQWTFAPVAMTSPSPADASASGAPAEPVAPADRVGGARR